MIVNNLRVEDICSFIGGSQPAKSQFINELAPGYVRLIQTRDYKTDSYLTYIPQGSTKKFCDEEDVMIGRYGPPVFQICRGLKGAYNVALMKAKPKEGIDREFLYYFLKQDSVFRYVDKLSARTGGQTGVDLVSLNKYPVRVPCGLEEQQRLVAPLVYIDKKIDVNDSICDELEAMVRTLYDYWFVQFDFPSNEGKPYKSSGGQMVFDKSLNSEVPDGWQHKVALNNNDERLLKPFDVVVNSTGVGTLGRVAYVKRLLEKETTVDSHVSIVRANRDLISSQYLAWYLMKYQPVIESAANGSTGQVELSKGFLENIDVIIPSESIVQDFIAFVEPIVSLLATREAENEQLISVRDWLLPMLMNGQVTVK